MEANFIGPFQLRLSVPTGYELHVYRETPKNLPLVDFTDGSGISELTLDTNAKQAVFLAAESADAVGSLVSGDLTGLVSAANSAASAASTAASAANSAASAASTAASAASTAASAASTAASDAVVLAVSSVKDTLSSSNPLEGDELIAHRGTTVRRALDANPQLQYTQSVDTTGVTDSLAAVNTAIAALSSKDSLQITGKVLVSAEPTNPLGVRLHGSGILVKPVTGGQQQLNTYVDENKYFVAPEYASRVFQRIKINNGNPVTIICYGDSWMQGLEVASAFRVQNLWPKMAKHAGLKMPIVVDNRGVSGTKVSALTVGAELTSSVDCLIIGYGVNDGLNPESTRLYTFAAAFDAKLAAIRAARGVDNLTIILKGAGSTADTPNGRDERWYEQLHNVYLQLARKHKCCYADCYSFLKDSRGAANVWMDDPYADGRGLHLDDKTSARLWGKIFDDLFGVSQLVEYKGNAVTNTSGAFEAMTAAALPATYEFGVSTARAPLVNGWPIDGAVTTIRQLDGVTMQMLYPFAGSTVIAKRTSVLGTNSWGVWSGHQQTPPLFNGWVAFGPGLDACTAVRSDDGYVHISLNIKSGVTTAGTLIAQLPVGLRPAAPVPGYASANGVHAEVLLSDNGDLTVNTPISDTRTSIQFSFRGA